MQIKQLLHHDPYQTRGQFFQLSFAAFSISFFSFEQEIWRWPLLCSTPHASQARLLGPL